MSVVWAIGTPKDTDDFKQALQEWRESRTDRATLGVFDIPAQELSRIMLRAQELKQLRVSNND